jgi:hypothetical protein
MLCTAEPRWIVARRRPQSPQYVEYWGSLRPCLAAMERIPGDETRSAKPS